MKTRLKFLPLCLTLAFAVVPALKAQSDDAAKPAREHGGGRGPNFDGFADRLGLSADQKEKIEPIWKKQEEQGRAILKDKSLSQEEKQDKIKAARAETQKAIEALLTPDQVKKFAEMREHGPRGDRPKGEKKGDNADK